MISCTTSAPSRRVSLRKVDSSGTRSVIPIRQNRRKWSESDTSRINVSYPQPERCLTIISRTYVSIAIVGRPRPDEAPVSDSSRSHRAPIGASSPGSASSSSSRARSSGSTRTSAGRISSHNDSVPDA